MILRPGLLFSIRNGINSFVLSRVTGTYKDAIAPVRAATKLPINCDSDTTKLVKVSLEKASNESLIHTETGCTEIKTLKANKHWLSLL